MKGMRLVLVIAVMMAASQSGFAEIIDLTTNTSGNFTVGEIGDALYIRVDQAPVGSGVINSFVRINPGGSPTDGAFEKGYNTDGRPLQYDENTSPTFTRSLQLANVPIVSFGSGICAAGCREFILDINQTASDPLLSLLRVVVTLRPAGDLLGASSGGADDQLGAAAGLFSDDSLVYDSGATNRVQLDYNFGAGSGRGDMFLYIPDSLFVGPNQFVYLYSEFGDAGQPNCPSAFPNCYADSNDGYEEWAVQTPTTTQVPEPTTLVLLGVGLVGLAAAKRASRS